MSKMTSQDSLLDKILSDIGDFGKYQILTFGLVCFVVVLHSAVHIAYVFTAKDADYRCYVPGCETNNTYLPDQIRNAIPFTTDGKPVKCEMYSMINNSTTNNNCSPYNFAENNTIKCNSFVYANDEYSILREYNIMCDQNAWKLALVGTVNNIGQFFGLFAAGIVSDKYGRRFVLIMGMVVCGIFGLIKAFSPSYEWFLVFEFLDAFFGSGTYACGFIIGVELVTPQKRVLTGAISSSCYAVGEIFAATAALLTYGYWKNIVFILYGPCVFVIFCFWYLPESVRWNLSRGEMETAKQTLRKVAKCNGKKLSEDTLEKLTTSHESGELIEVKPCQFKDLIKSTSLLLRFINCSFCWITCAFLFYGLTLNSVTLSENTYIDFMLTSTVEIPAYFSCTYFVEKIGRKYSLAGSFILTAFACFSFIFVQHGSYWQSLVVYLLGKFGATAAFTIVYVITSEMFPTPLRHTMMGLCSTLGRIGSMVSPQTPLLSQLWKPLPLVMFSSLSAVCGLLTMFFPETVNIKLPDTIEEAERIGRPSITKSNESELK